MTHKEKVEYFKQDLQQRGHEKIKADPLFFRLLWAVGIKIPPPMFLSYSSNALIGGVPFGIFMGVFMMFTVFKTLTNDQFWPSLGGGVAAALVIGPLFGRWRASFPAKKAKELNLPSWKKYPSG